MKALEEAVSRFAISRLAGNDPSHDVLHVRRVLCNAKLLCKKEKDVDCRVMVAAAWLHDIVSYEKNSDQRKFSSVHSALEAADFLSRERLMTEMEIQAVSHAIEAHSFSAGIVPRTLEAKILQDADRLDALGAIGVARCMMTGGVMGASLYHPQELVPQKRSADDKCYIIDHFYAKLFKLAEGFHTVSGKEEAARRSTFMRQFLEEMFLEVLPVSDQE